MPIFAPQSSGIGWKPSVNGLLAANADPAQATVVTTVMTSGTVYWAKLALEEDKLYPITNIHLLIPVNGATLTSNQNFAGLYYLSSGTTLTQVGKTADQSSAWATGTAGRDAMMAMAGGPFNVRGGPGVFVAVAAICVHTGTAVTLSKFGGGLHLSVNAGIQSSAGWYRQARGGTGQTDLPGTYDYTSMVNDSGTALFWVGLS